MNYTFKLLILLVIISSMPAFSTPDAPCEAILSSPQTSVRASQRELHEQAELLRFDHLLTPAGVVRLYGLLLKGSVQAGFESYMQRVLPQLNHAEARLEINDNDSILGIDILGDKHGILRTLILGWLSQQAEDIVGITPINLNYRAQEDSLGRPRIYIVIKGNISDYRESVSASEKISSLDRAIEWVEDQMIQLFTETFPQNVFNISYNQELLVKIRNIVGSDLKRLDFLTKYEIAMINILGTIKPEELLYFRSSFWDENPAVDPGAIQLFKLATQLGDSLEFEKHFAENVIRLRQKLIDRILGKGKPIGAPARSGGYDYGVQLPRGEQPPELTGLGAQWTQGTDFFRGSTTDDIATVDLKDLADPTLTSALEKVDSHGFTDVHQLRHLEATNIMDIAHLTLIEFQALALELAEHGVYFIFNESLKLFLNLPIDVQRRIRTPIGQFFDYSINTHAYLIKTHRHNSR